MKPFAIILLAVLVLSGCRSNDSEFRVTGGSAQERAMVHGAINNMVPFLQSRGFDRVKKPTGNYVLSIQPTTEIWRYPDGGEQGVGINGGIRVGGRGGSRGMMIFRPLHAWTANHEVIHGLLALAGYIKESISHDLRAFDDGGTMPRGSRRVR
jgi:hypothetical protein